MDKFNSLYQQSKETESTWINSLKSFNDIHADDRAFEKIYGNDNKFKFDSNLFDILKRELDGQVQISDKPSSAAIYQTLVALRISLREQIPQEESLLIQNIGNFFKLGNIGENEKTNIYSDEIREEALKSLLNCTTRNKRLQATFDTEMNGPHLLTKELINGLDDKVALPIYKILIHRCTLPETRAIVCQAGIMDHLINQLEVRTTGANFDPSTILGDLFRLTFTATMHLGQLDKSGGKTTDPSDKEIEQCRKFFPIYKRIFTYHCDRDHPMYAIKMAVISALLNTPKQLLEELLDEVDLSYLEDILKSQSYFADKPEGPGELIPILMLLTNITQYIKATRDRLFVYTFPEELTKVTDEAVGITIETPKAALQHDTVSSKLIPLMTASDIGLKHFVSEFFYYICDEDPNEICRVTGYGNAAGLLAMKGLLSLGGQ
ncbi:hypothetical protein DFA_03519 [Cavenderia fasciculata]|uniref:Uncharacterized protein n=1 Tax=Cavenderia fasciculata TaxID=261658 RepID=F4PHT7_CACFS|nr:uncharacterized protein DFA_03519 [Cavenderia fasciculata]EGG25271.1 hypothetical protein DFA_03519 [Cavenderia fasciculata]|eukprot:XP_004363122.1 hypothetical protein DFA_03519 [Cavenderia fasciculata]